MKVKFLIFTGKCLLVLCASFCTLCALISAFEFTVPMVYIFSVLLISSITVTALTTKFQSNGILFASIFSLILLIWNYARIAEGFKQVVRGITTWYNNWLPVPVLFPEEEPVEHLIEQIFRRGPDSIPNQITEQITHETGQIVINAPEAGIFFAALGVAIVIALGAAICIKHSTVLTILPTLPFVLLTVVLRNTQAGAVYLIGLIVVYLAVFMSAALYQDDYNKRAQAFIPVFALSVVFAGIIYIAAPQQGYVRAGYVASAQIYLNGMIDRISNIFSGSSDEKSFAGDGDAWMRRGEDDLWMMFRTDSVNIAGAGERVIINQRLLEAETSQSGTFYLRGFSMNDFDGKAWNAEVIPNYFGYQVFNYQDIMLYTQAGIISSYIRAFAGEQDESMPPIPDITGINIRRISDITDVEYVPYYSSSDNMGPAAVHIDNVYFETSFYHVPGSIRTYVQAYEQALEETGFLQNDRLYTHTEEHGPFFAAFKNELNTDAISLSNSDVFDDYVDRLLSTMLSHINHTYTQIDAATAVGLRYLAGQAGIDPAQSRENVADAVANYIKNTARYTLTPPVTPDEEDFALYFLQTSQQGYCIHFATAATLMLRALDIPARFTSGYITTVSRFEAGSTVVLTDANAHAWVEVFYDDAGWLPLEVTPSTAASGIPIPPPHTAAQQAGENVIAPTPVPAQFPDGDINTSANQSADRSSDEHQTLYGMLIYAGRFTGIIVTLISILVTRFKIINAVRRKRFAQSDTNAAVIYMWKYAGYLCRGGSVIPTDIEELALKARFSQHRISEAERSKMLKYVRRLSLELYDSKEEYGKFWFRYIRALG